MRRRDYQPPLPHERLQHSAIYSPFILILELHTFKFEIMSLLAKDVSRPIYHLHRFFFSLPLPLLTTAIVSLSHLLIGASTHPLFTFPNQLSPDSLILSSTEATPNLVQYNIISNLISPSTHTSMRPFSYLLPSFEHACS